MTQTNNTEASAPANPFQAPCQASYFNGFAMAVGTGDIAIALQLNGEPTIVLNTSYTVAKTMAQGLNKLISELERKTGTTIMTTEDIAPHLTSGTP